MKYSQVPAEKFQFYTRTWATSGPPLATVVFVHGFAEHCDRYDHVFQRVAKAGLEVFSYDGRGFGQSASNKTAGVTGGWPRQIADLDYFVKSKKREGIPQFLWGHSMGGALALKYGLDGPSRAQLSGIVASAPLLKNAPETRPNALILKLGSLAAKVLPDQIISVVVKVKDCTRDPAFIESGEADELLRPYGSLGGVSSMLQGGDYLMKPENHSRFTKPLYLYHGTGDVVNSHHASREFFKGISSEDKTHKEYDGAYHELHNDFDRDQVIEAVISWIVARAKAHPESNSKL